MTKILADAGDVKKLAERLNQCECVSKFDSEDEPESWRLAHSLADMEQSFREVLDNLLPTLCSASDNDEIHEVLLDIGEELRHILYHINDPEFYRYLKEE